MNEDSVIIDILNTTQRTRGVITLSDLSTLRLRKVTPYQYALLELEHSVIINVTPDGMLEPALLTHENLRILSRNIRPISSKYIDRPYINTTFETIDEFKRRESFNIKRDLDYEGCDKIQIRKIATSKELSLKRANYYIDEIDDKISVYLNKKLYPMDVAKRPRINLLDYFNLVKILPNKLFHLVNIIGTNSSLIMHRRSQRTSAFKSTSPLTRMERLFFWCANPSDGHYEFPFIESEFIKFIDTDLFKKRFPLSEAQRVLLKSCIDITRILESALETEAGCILIEQEYEKLYSIKELRDSLVCENDLYIFQNFHSEKLVSTKSDVQYWLNELDRQRFKTYKPKNSNITEVAMPGNAKQKAFFSERFTNIQQLKYSTLIKNYPDLLSASQVIPPHSLGRLSKEGRLKVKKNLIELYKYYQYVQHKHIMSEDHPYWINELQFLDKALILNILLWQTNCLRTIIVI